MDKVLHTYRNFAPILLFFLYALGYIFLTNYFSTFGIDIIYYLNLTDIIFFALGLLILMGFAIFIVEIGLILLQSLLLYLFNKKGSEVSEESANNYKLLSFVLLFLMGFLTAYLSGYYLYIFSILFTMLPIKMISLTVNKNDSKEDRNKLYLFGMTLLAIILVVLTFLYSYHEAFNVKDGEGFLFQKKIEFDYSNESFTNFNNPELIYIGETTNNLFFYLKSENKTQIFYKSDLENLKYIDPTNLDDSEKKDREATEKSIKLFKEKLNQSK